MTNETRRGFLKSAAALTGATAAAAMFPSAIRKALAIQANNATKSIEDVEHIVVLMQENRAFDHYFGTLPGVRGFGDRFPIPLPGGRNVFQQSNGERIVMPYHLDQEKGNAQRVLSTHHTWPDAQDAWDNGRMTNWPEHKENRSMGYFKEAELPFQFALANAFTLCDHYHCSSHTGTFPNRLFHWTGTNGPTGTGEAVVINEMDSLGPAYKGYKWTTYPERLQKAGVKWKVYQNLPDNFSDNPLHGFRTYRAASMTMGNLPSGFPFIPYNENKHEAKDPLYKGCSNTMRKLGGMLHEFAEDVADGKLPQVSWIVAPTFYSEHPSVGSPVQGAWYVQEALNALTAVPEVWSKTVFIVNFDENDGFFDHLPPPSPFSLNPDGSPAGASTISDDDLQWERFNHPAPTGTRSQPDPDGRVYGPGPRVPCFVVSPWSKGGWVNSQVFDHTSVLRFIEARFGVAEENITPYRRAICGDLTSCFDFVNPNAEVPDLPNSTRIKVDAFTAAQALSLPIFVPSEDEQSLPEQPVDVRPSRALPYVLYTNANVREDKVTLMFKNTGTVGAVFHVYDRLNLDAVPRRYSVEAGKTLNGTWDISGQAGKYDLWVLGPNGYHRHFIGDTTVAQEDPEVRVVYATGNRQVSIVIDNGGTRSCTVDITANAYEAYSERRAVPAGGRVVVSRSLANQGNWYDYTVTVDGNAAFQRRVAGRMETGKDGISDPARLMAQITG
ncbi:phospholipase C, phosphocholine-specific [Zavarzinia compransoris]|uniref:phosphocholine-specific phospholipase C n=1 Tax=Zavarzinia marina TaxID=2911065 RepID=UPI001F1F97E3|nr:phospholipase C, phosphocholine-specific [Zavarzinia marina]MCF4164777.1 phospholipase C, phosphocholine-specific [Zavarzinia marina]